MKVLKFFLILLLFNICPLFADEYNTYEYDDPNYTRLFLTPTAETVKKGSAYVGVTEVVLFQYAYGITDSTQFGVSFPIYPVAAAFVLKNEIYNRDNKILSFQLGLGTPLVISKDFGGVGLMGGMIFSNGNRNKRFTISSNFIGTISKGDDNFFGILIGAGYERRTSERVKWIFEFTALPVFINGEFQSESPRGITIGPRFFGRNFAADLGFLFPLHSFSGDLVYIFFPVFNFAYHF